MASRSPILWLTGMPASARWAICAAALAALASRGALAQDRAAYRGAYPAGLSLESGIGTLALRDEFISRERYSGALPSIKVTWSRFQGESAYELSLDYQRSSAIRNFNVAATVTQFSVRQGFLYPLTRFRLLSRDAYAFLGPSAELFLLFNEPQVAVANPNFSESGAGLVSLGIDSRILAPWGHGLQAELSMGVAVLSLGLRVVDKEEHDVSPVKLLTPLSGLHGRVGLGLRYRLGRRLSALASARIQVLRISSWDPLTSVNTGLALGLTVGL
jgi:hypothetical protein